jgi:hypothetical protein
MDAYLVPVLSAAWVAGAALAVLGAVRLGRWVASLGRGAAAPAWTPGPGIAGDKVDPHLSRLAYRTLGATLYLGLATNLFFALSRPDRLAVETPALAVVVALASVWLVRGSPR